MWVLPPPEAVLDPYNNSLVMPLHEWVEHPIAEELMHNGATLQVRVGGRASVAGGLAKPWQCLAARNGLRSFECMPHLLSTTCTCFLQVLGLTNFSHWPRDEAAPLRACLRSNAVAREMLLKLAARRLRAMAHVGLTERLEESVVSMAADLGASGCAKCCE